MANHTTPIDVVILQNDITYALVSSHNISEMWLAQRGYLDYLVQIDSGGAAVALSIFAIDLTTSGNRLGLSVLVRGFAADIVLINLTMILCDYSGLNLWNKNGCSTNSKLSTC